MICYEYALYAADTFAKLPREGNPDPLRFIYVSGCNAERDPAKKPWILGDYCLLRVRLQAHRYHIIANSASRAR